VTDIPFVQARHFTPGVRTSRNVRLVVLHSTENAEKPGKAMDVAKWFAGPGAPQASAHYVVDAGQTVQCVFENDIAWAAPGVNSYGIQVEMVGYARQLAEDWADTYSAAMLERAAALVADICKRYEIPVVAVTAEGLKAGVPGITRHSDASEAFKLSTHTDPGAGFPMQAFVARVGQIASGK
jgi:N-acetyl-anhydromuramyl-L-alanine amidase AmpD